jgi:hypothetical protein
MTEAERYNKYFKGLVFTHGKNIDKFVFGNIIDRNGTDAVEILFNKNKKEIFAIYTLDEILKYIDDDINYKHMFNNKDLRKRKLELLKNV